MSANNNMLTITGGQSNYPLAYIETDRTLEFTFASAEFSLDMFGMANATPIKKKDTSTLESKLYRVGVGLTITIPYQTKEGSLRIKGFTEADGAPEAGKFTVDYGQDGEPETVITFNTGDCAVGDTMRVAYRRRVNGASVATVLTNSRTAKGSLSAHWPVYSSGTDANDSSIKGYLHLEIPRVRVTALPGFDNSYKSAATNSITFAAIDPKDADAQMYSLTFEPLDGQGQVITTPSDDAAEW